MTYCRGCYRRFNAPTKTIKFCSDKCRRLVKWELAEARLLDTGATDAQLAKHRRYHPKYRMKRILLGQDKIDIQAYTETMTELREGRIRAGRIEDVTLSALIQRDKGICYLCGKKVEKQRKFKRGEKYGDMTLYPSIDHVIPISRGGTHTWDNVRLAHRSCNSKKGGRANYTPK